MIGLVVKGLRETWGVTLAAGVGFALVAVLFHMIIPALREQLLDLWSGMPFIQTMVGALMGVRLEGDEISARVFLSIIWTHPIVLAMLWAHAVIVCTRFPAGEVDRGTADVLLGWPVSRRGVLGAEAAVWAVGSVAVIALGLVGNWIGGMFVEEGERTGLGSVWRIVLNLVCLQVAVGGLAALVSAMSSRRGRAIGVVFGILIASFAWTFVGAFWDPAGTTSFLSVLDYYRPAQVVMDGGLAVGDCAVLLGVGVVMWAVAWAVVVRRDVATV